MTVTRPSPRERKKDVIIDWLNSIPREETARRLPIQGVKGGFLRHEREYIVEKYRRSDFALVAKEVARVDGLRRRAELKAGQNPGRSDAMGVQEAAQFLDVSPSEFTGIIEENPDLRPNGKQEWSRAALLAFVRHRQMIGVEQRDHQELREVHGGTANGAVLS